MAGILLFFCAVTTGFAIKSTVRITAGGTDAMREFLEQRLTVVVNSLAAGSDVDSTEFFTADGYDSFMNLVGNTSCRNVNPLYEVKLLDLPDGGFEVRGIKVKMDMRGTSGNPYQYLVFILDRDGRISDVRFALERWNYLAVMGDGEPPADFAYRRLVLEFLETFRTAYDRKDLEFLRRIYSDDALIIVGKVLKPKKEAVDRMARGSLSRERIKLIKLSKREYIQRLEKVFAVNEFIKVNFSGMKVKRHPYVAGVYGVTLEQDWHSTHYSDRGYLFLMIDYRDLEHPLIHVRSWQSERFPDGSVVNLGDFELID